MDAKTRFEENTSLVYFLLHKNFPTLAYDEDIQQVGMQGLWKACIKFDESRGYQFSTLASRCIYGTIAQYLRSPNKENKLQKVSISDYTDHTGIPEEHIHEFRDRDNQYEYLEIVDSLNHVLERYTDKNRKIIELYLNDMNQSNISKEVGCSQPQVSRIINKFRKDMEEELYEIPSR